MITIGYQLIFGLRTLNVLFDQVLVYLSSLHGINEIFNMIGCAHVVFERSQICDSRICLHRVNKRVYCLRQVYL